MQVEHTIARLVAFYCSRTKEYESKYHSFEFDTLALVESVEHFRIYLYGRATAMKKDLRPGVARWWIKRQDYDFSVEYRLGHKMAHVDYLSRNPVYTVCVVREISSSSNIDSNKSHIGHDKCLPKLRKDLFYPKVPQIVTYTKKNIRRLDRSSSFCFLGIRET